MLAELRKGGGAKGAVLHYSNIQNKRRCPNMKCTGQMHNLFLVSIYSETLDLSEGPTFGQGNVQVTVAYIDCDNSMCRAVFYS